jgi:DNA-directed RNA polymerase specialized sigma24 family protein
MPEIVTDDDLLAEYYGWLRTVAGNLTGFDDPGLDDLIQEGYIAMWQALQNYDPDKGQLAPRLKYMAKQRMRNVAYGHHQWTGHAPVRGGQEPPVVEHYDALEDAAEFVMPRAELPELPEPAIMAAVGDLPDQQREYVYLRFWAGGGIFGKTAGMDRLRAEFPVLRNDKLWARARETLRNDPRMQQAAHLR